MHHPISITLSPAVQETLDLMLEFSGDRYPDDICGKQAMGDAANVIQMLRSELKSIAASNRFDRAMFANDSEWADWVQSRARFVAQFA